MIVTIQWANFRQFLALISVLSLLEHRERLMSNVVNLEESNTIIYLPVLIEYSSVSLNGR